MAPVEVNVAYDPDAKLPEHLLGEKGFKKNLPKLIADALNVEHKVAGHSAKPAYPEITQQDVAIVVSEMDPEVRGLRVLDIVVQAGAEYSLQIEVMYILIRNKIRAGPWERRGWVETSRLTLKLVNGEERSGYIGGPRVK